MRNMNKAKVTLFFLWKLKMGQRNGTAEAGLTRLVDDRHIYVPLAMEGAVLRSKAIQSDLVADTATIRGQPLDAS